MNRMKIEILADGVKWACIILFGILLVICWPFEKLWDYITRMERR